MPSLPPYVWTDSRVGRTLGSLIRSLHPDKVGLVCDENTQKLCRARIRVLQEMPFLAVKAGESHKNIETCQQIWNFFTDLGFTRNSLAIGLGGGVVGDMAGFAAATYKRGIRFVFLPTTLLSAVDSAVGGKMGVNYRNLKNHIGVFRDPDAVIIGDFFLSTLPPRQIRSGFCEVLKHALIRDREFWSRCEGVDLDRTNSWQEILIRSVEIKQEIVDQDPFEQGLRKILNFGHTIGHALETWHLDKGEDMLHGEAVAQGMICEAYLSHRQCGLLQQDLQAVVRRLKPFCGSLLAVPPYSSLENILLQDKKNAGGKVLFSLLPAIGECEYNLEVGMQVVKEGLRFLQENLGPAP